MIITAQREKQRYIKKSGRIRSWVVMWETTVQNSWQNKRLGREGKEERRNEGEKEQRRKGGQDKAGKE